MNIDNNLENKNSVQNIEIVQASAQTFKLDSLDKFVLNQVVRHCYRKCNGEYKLLPVEYVEDWDFSTKRKIAEKLIKEMSAGSVLLTALKDNEVIGFALITNVLFGRKKQYIDLAEFYVSKPFRRCGIGQKLFEHSCLQAKKSGGEKLYISAHSAEESISAYKKYGCTFAKEIDSVHAQNEPFDLQLEFDLKEKIFEAENKCEYLNLLLLADEQQEMVAKYIDKVTMFVLYDCGVKGEICVMDVGNNTLEIKNLAVFPKFQKCGYGKKLIDFVCEKYKTKFDHVQVGTGDSPLTLPFYEKCGFVKSHIIKDFFINNYDHKIFEGGVQLVDMVYLTKQLN